jgi:hypothetical protein
VQSGPLSGPVRSAGVSPLVRAFDPRRTRSQIASQPGNPSPLRNGVCDNCGYVAQGWVTPQLGFRRPLNWVAEQPGYLALDNPPIGRHPESLDVDAGQENAVDLH